MDRRLCLLAALLPIGLAAGALPGGAAAAEPEALLARLREGGCAVLIRHAITDPGVGDPPGFRLGECATQRNLSEPGRAQAGRIGAFFRARKLQPAKILSSGWCRCVDTATLAFGSAEVWSELNSLFGDRADETMRQAAIAGRLGGIGVGRFEVWVTHQVNVSALTGEGLAMGDACVVVPDRGATTGLRSLGRLGFG